MAAISDFGEDVALLWSDGVLAAISSLEAGKMCPL